MISVSSVWSSVGLFFTVTSIISLFGELGEITLSEWLENFLEAYRIFVALVLDFVLYPVKQVFDFSLSATEKDILVIGFFFVDRLLADMMLTFLAGIEGVKINKYPKEIFRSKLLLRYRAARRLLLRYFLVANGAKRVLSGHYVTLILRKVLAVGVPVWIITGDAASFILGMLAAHQEDYIYLFFLFMFIVPIFCMFFYVLLAAIGIFQFFIFGFAYVVALLCSVFLPVFTELRQILLRKCKTMKVVSDEGVLFFKLSMRQMKFNLTFTMVFLLIIGFNYKYLSN